MSTLELIHNTLVLRTPYNADLVGDLKANVPSSERRWNKEARAWEVAPQHGALLQHLVQRHLGETLDMPVGATYAPTEATRIFEVRYVGATKERGNERTAFGWVRGEWSVIFPESVLRAWFMDEAKPGEERTLYGVLGIAPSAAHDALRSAYRRLARQWHPDLCKETDATEQFRAIQHAYEILSDPAKRAKYNAGLALATRVRSSALAEEILASELSRGYRSPLRCGLIMASGHEVLGRFVVSVIRAWQDIVAPDGHVLVTSWPAGADTFVENWL